MLLWPKNVCIQTCMRQPFVCEYTYRVFAFSVCHQVQNELSQKTENLHREVAQKQQLSEEFEQVSLVHFFFPFLFFFSLVTAGSDNKLTVDKTSVCACVVNLQAQRTVTELQAQLDLLKDSAEAPQADTEDVAQLKVGSKRHPEFKCDLCFYFFDSPGLLCRVS